MQDTKNKDISGQQSQPAHGTGVAANIGDWAVRHRDYFRSDKGDLLARNLGANMVAWIPTITSFAFTRAAWAKYEEFAARNKDALFTKIAKPLLGKEYPTGRMIGFIFGGWFTYRTATRLYHRAYDRLFAAKDVATATEVVRATPHKMAGDLKEILPGGIAEVAVGAPILAGVKAALVPVENFISVNKGEWARARKGYVNDWVATGLAYSAFTEWCEHVYPSVTHGKDTPEYYRKLKELPEKEKTPDDQKKFGFFTSDGVGRITFRTTASVLLGFAAYFAGQRAIKAAIGVPTNIEHTLVGITKNFAKDYAAWAAPFGLYTGIAQIYKSKYDALFERLESHKPLEKSARTI